MKKLNKWTLYTGKGEICSILVLLLNHIYLHQIHGKERTGKEEVWLEKF